MALPQNISHFGTFCNYMGTFSQILDASQAAKVIEHDYVIYVQVHNCRIDKIEYFVINNSSFSESCYPNCLKLRQFWEVASPFDTLVSCVSFSFYSHSLKICRN